MMTVYRPPSDWIPIAALGFGAMLVHILILYKELKNRSIRKPQFIVKNLQLWSLLCIICGVLWGLNLTLRFFPFFCYFGGRIGRMFSRPQAVFVGFYQLSRLYYCFSTNQVHSKKGYPTWLFIIMYSIGIAVIMSTCILPWFFVNPNITCGLNQKFEYFPFWPGTEMYGKSISIINFIYSAWDLITFSLYIVIIVSFKKFKTENIQIYQRVRNILDRIIVLTIFYELLSAISIMMAFLYNLIPWNANYLNALTWTIFGMEGIGFSLSVFLMQHYNTREYVKFLRILYMFKCHWIICICCQSIVTNGLKLEDDETIAAQSPTSPTHNDEHDTMHETQDLSIKQTHREMTQMSIETTVPKSNHLIK